MCVCECDCLCVCVCVWVGGVAQDVEELPDPELQLVLAVEAVARDVEEADLLQLIAVAEPNPRKHGKRSWALMQHARASKKAKSDLAAITKQRALLLRADDHVQNLASEFPIVAQRLGIKTKKGLVDDRRAQLVTRVSFMPGIKGNRLARNNQNRACAVVSDVLEVASARYAHVFFMSTSPEL